MINQLNLGQALGQGAALGTVMQRAGQDRELQNVFAQHGEGLLRGDPAAMNALAAVDGQMAWQMRRQAAADKRAIAADTRGAKLDDLRIKQMLSQMSAAELETERAKLERGIAAASAARTPEEWDQIAQQFGAPDLVGRFNERGPLLRQFMTIKDIMDQENPRGGIAFEMGADGTFRFGTNGLPPAGGQDPLSTNTPRDGGKLAQKLSENDAATIQEVTDAGRAAADLGSLGRQLETVAGKVGYTGPGGGLLGAVDDVVGFLPGDTGARGAFKSLAMEAQLAFTEKTKGAITDREMGMFREAVPNLGQRPEANKAISQVMQAGAKRVQTRAAFFENWARKHGSLEGAGEVWSEYMEANPIIRDNGDGIAVNPEGDWREWLNRKPANSYSPESIMQMTERVLVDVPIESMTDAQLSALEARWAQIKGAQ